MTDAAFMGFDVVLMVSATRNETEAFVQRHTLPSRVSIANTFGQLGKSDSPFLERWKVQAFFGTLVQPERHDWFVMLDDDTLPNLASLTRILCLLALQGEADGATTANATAFTTSTTTSTRTLAHGRKATRGLYMGWATKDFEGNSGYLTGQGFLMDQQGVRTLQRRMQELPRVQRREACHSAALLARTPRWWAACCAVNDGVVRSFDFFIGTCLASTAVSLVSIGDTGSGWWGRLFHHGGLLKLPEKLQLHATRARQQGWEAAGDAAQREGFRMHGVRQASPPPSAAARNSTSTPSHKPRLASFSRSSSDTI